MKDKLEIVDDVVVTPEWIDENLPEGVIMVVARLNTEDEEVNILSKLTMVETVNKYGKEIVVYSPYATSDIVCVLVKNTIILSVPIELAVALGGFTLREDGYIIANTFTNTHMRAVSLYRNDYVMRRCILVVDDTIESKIAATLCLRDADSAIVMNINTLHTITVNNPYLIMFTRQPLPSEYHSVLQLPLPEYDGSMLDVVMDDDAIRIVTYGMDSAVVTRHVKDTVSRLKDFIKIYDGEWSSDRVVAKTLVDTDTIFEIISKAARGDLFIHTDDALIANAYNAMTRDYDYISGSNLSYAIVYSMNPHMISAIVDYAKVHDANYAKTIYMSLCNSKSDGVELVLGGDLTNPGATTLMEVVKVSDTLKYGDDVRVSEVTISQLLKMMMSHHIRSSIVNYNLN